MMVLKIVERICNSTQPYFGAMNNEIDLNTDVSLDRLLRGASPTGNEYIIVGQDMVGNLDLEDLKKDSVSLRTACRVCEHFTPPEVDICIMSIGVDSGYLLVTDRDELIEGLNLKDGEVPAGREEKVGAILEIRREAGREMAEDMRERLSKYDSLMEVFQHCIRCDNCREMCPICYCKECYFQTALGDPKTDEMVHQAGIKGILRVPPDILFYHLTRNIHVAMGCVECGSCEEGCPRDIPLMSIWRSITPDVQSLFDYVSGEKKDEPLPLVSFKESELQEMGSE